MNQWLNALKKDFETRFEEFRSINALMKFGKDPISKSI